MDDAMLAAEQFCSMVVHQIVSLNDDGSSHKNQLDVYHSVHKDLFGNWTGRRLATKPHDSIVQLDKCELNVRSFIG